MQEWDKLVEDMRRMRDELRLQVHLGTKEAEEEWDRIEREWSGFISKAQLDQSAEEIGDAARELALKFKAAYDRARKAAD